ncbi:Kinesin motor domain family protein [Babesia bovis T2Bo]|uniref:Kinesin-like protein n=1 Tax=Babesia bovis TaxID=5865 RepID=A7AVV8_BABBO|nr:Kinesin motor domain family protein [Babesia bovis T2Bo]EDO05934.1 Kinesin motor domain family protein [Babesia bovis T2Bo]|eukprot:XP_001609502.1 kinesin [Babesia bovis T2Bo]
MSNGRRAPIAMGVNTAALLDSSAGVSPEKRSREQSPILSRAHRGKLALRLVTPKTSPQGGRSTASVDSTVSPLIPGKNDQATHRRHNDTLALLKDLDIDILTDRSPKKLGRSIGVRSMDDVLLTESSCTDLDTTSAVTLPSSHECITPSRRDLIDIATESRLPSPVISNRVDHLYHGTATPSKVKILTATEMSTQEVMMQYYSPRRSIGLSSPQSRSTCTSMAQGTISDSIKVVVRVRPVDPSVIPVIQVVDNVIEVHRPGNAQSVLDSQRPKVCRYHFDSVFDAEATQEDVYNATSRDLVQKAFDGINGTVFAYGCTSAGKTYTMVGENNTYGIVQMTLASIFEHIEKVCPETEAYFSFMEVYNETVFDLLAPVYKSLDVQEVSGEVKVPLLSVARVNSLPETLALLSKGIKARKKAMTDANRHSSRSHAIMQVSVHYKKKRSKVTFIDLAGSERSGITSNGARAKECGHINQSLLALANCISALSDTSASRTKVKYRDSKLTLLLKNVLFTNAEVIMIAAIHPGTQFIHETQNSLMYARRAKDVKVDFQVEDSCNEYDYDVALNEAYTAIMLIGQTLSDEARNDIVQMLRAEPLSGREFLVNLLSSRVTIQNSNSI